MDWDEAVGKQASKGFAVGEDLSRLSIAELEARVAALKDEITRVETQIAVKRGYEAAASALFGS
ncbi:MAG: DUF1192 domain-containing protein [Hyphomicrobiaceae bacterium]